MSALIVEAVVREGHIHILDDFYKARAVRACKKWRNGTALTIRIEPQGDAAKWGQFKYLFGYVIEPLIEYTGDPDWKQELKAKFLPENVTSLSDLDYAGLKLFTEKAEAWARQRCPEAYEQCGRQYVG